MLSATNRGRLIGIIALAGVLTLAATPVVQSPQDAIIVFYRVRTVDPVKAQTSRIRRIFDRTAPLDPDQDPTIYQMTAGGATRLAIIAKGEFFELHVRPGHYAFSWTSGPARGEQTVISVKAGQRAFVQVQFRRITEVAAQTAMMDLKDLQPTSDVRVFDSAVRIPPDILSARQPVVPAPAPSDDTASAQQPSLKEAGTTPSPPQQEIVIREDLPKRTLGWIQQTYLKQSIIVRGSVDRGMLVDWNGARKDANGYKRDVRSISAKYRGQMANVIAIQMPDEKTISEHNVEDPSFELVAQFADGMLGMTATGFEFLADRAKLASEQKQREAEMTKNLPLIVGKPL